MIVVTGANGFIGSNIVLRLSELAQAQIVSCDDYPAIRNTGGQSKRIDAARYFRGTRVSRYIDFNDLPAWLDAQGDSVQAIVHMGACSDTTVTDREYVMRVNTDFTRTLWHWCTKNQKPLIYASSAATYGDGSAGYDDDIHPRAYQPLNLYGESKQLFDLWALEQKDTPPRWAGLKFFNVYGQYEYHKRRMASVAYHAFHQIHDTGKVRLFESHKAGIPHGGQKRDFIYVDDAVEAALHLLDVPASDAAPNGLYNVGTGRARTFEDLALAVFLAMDLEAKIEYFPMPEDLRGKYQYFTEASTAKIERSGVRWPFHSVEQGVHQYVRKFLTPRTLAAR